MTELIGLYIVPGWYDWFWKVGQNCIWREKNWSVGKTFRECINIPYVGKISRAIDHLLSESSRVFHPWKKNKLCGNFVKKGMDFGRTEVRQCGRCKRVKLSFTTSLLKKKRKGRKRRKKKNGCLNFCCSRRFPGEFYAPVEAQLCCFARLVYRAIRGDRGKRFSWSNTEFVGELYWNRFIIRIVRTGSITGYFDDWKIRVFAQWFSTTRFFFERSSRKNTLFPLSLSFSLSKFMKLLH